MSGSQRHQIAGLILTRRQHETPQGVELELWLATKEGPCRVFLPAQRYVFLIHQQQLVKAQALWSAVHLTPNEIRPLSLTSFNGLSVSAIYCLNNKMFRQLQDILTTASIPIFEADIKVCDRYLMERFIYGTVSVQGECHWQGHYWHCRAAKISPATVTSKLKQVSLDIECSPLGELYSVGLSYGNTDSDKGSALLDSDCCATVLMIGEHEPCDDINIQWVANEQALLCALEAWFQWHDPDAVIGWAVTNFDLRLLVKRADAHNMPLRLGRDGSALRWLPHRQAPDQGTVILNGRVVLEGIDQLKNAGWMFESFSLEFVSQAMLSAGKLLTNPHNYNHNKGLEIKRQFEQEPVSLARYNLQDCLLVERIFAKAQLTEYAIQRARLTGLALDRRGASVAAFTNLYLPLLHRSGYIAPNIGDIEAQHSPGGFVMDSIPGLYDWVLVLDFKSLYPSIIRSFKIDPMGMIEGLKENEKNAIPGFRGARFSRNKHHLPDILDKLTAARESAKKENNQPFQHAIKIIMNSMYGVLGSAGCRFHDTRLASSITLRGHQIMLETRDFIEQQGEQVVYGDTDSTFVWLKHCTNAIDAQARGKVLEKRINQYWSNKLNLEFQLDCFLEIEFETCFRKFFMPTLRGSETGSKKRYAGLKVTNDGELMLFKGLETVRSDWTELAQDFQKKLYAKVFANEPIDSLVIDTVELLNKGELDQQLIYHKRLGRPLNAYLKNVPPQVRAARLADQINANLGRPLQYQRSGRIAYLITVNGPEPADYRQSCIDYQHYIDKQLKPIAEAILPLLSKNFDDMISDQMRLF
ncbi:DNA damage-inducible DNA polymerase II [Psychromonas ingrahamii 37]|uniref:DNA polymerase n=1 Tax=Psychromonas ingrahamii (strain DSM 17664 / CCUG 51855 / 37) TaxID=357804 RepID=A1SVW9_PSYIN|nr:DNA polymerase II [Psychromonas ingrahamii]ABM03634.1 DNA damage-inducible DNA polymerase II [Psychromonas ingrahamii 37]